MEWYIFAILSAIISGITPIIDKKILKKVSVLDFSVMHSLGTFLLSLSLLSLTNFIFDPVVTLITFIGAAFATLGFYSINKALKRYEISLVSPLRSFNPAILLIMAVVFLGESITLSNAAGIFLIVLGTYIIEARNILHKPLLPLKHMLKSAVMLLVLMSGIFYAVSSMVDKVVLASYDLFSFIVLIHLFIALNFMIVNLVENRKAVHWTPKIKSVMTLVVAAVIVTFSYRFLLLKAVSLAFVSLVVAIKHMDSLVAVVLGGEIFHEKHLKKKIAAALIMLLGVLLVVL